MATYEPAPEERHAEGRLLAAVRRLLATALAMVQTRAELLATEMQEEVHRAASVLLWAFVALLFMTLSVLMIAVTLLVAFWEEHRLLVAVLVTATFIAVAVGTLEELKRDRAVVERTE